MRQKLEVMHEQEVFGKPRRDAVEGNNSNLFHSRWTPLYGIICNRPGGCRFSRHYQTQNPGFGTSRPNPGSSYRRWRTQDMEVSALGDCRSSPIKTKGTSSIMLPANFNASFLGKRTCLLCPLRANLVIGQPF